jgi:hypothetical protein
VTFFGHGEGDRKNASGEMESNLSEPLLNKQENTLFVGGGELVRMRNGRPVPPLQVLLLLRRPLIKPPTISMPIFRLARRENTAAANLTMDFLAPRRHNHFILNALDRPRAGLEKTSISMCLI